MAESMALQKEKMRKERMTKIDREIEGLRKSNLPYT